MFDTLQRCSR